ncbi:MAG: YkgJ family cysteine cluster protein [Chitinophagaceae bacterium]
MLSMQPINLRSFKQKARHTKAGMRRFLSKLEKNIPRGIDLSIARLEKEMWKETDCLSCANCCKTMTPTFTNQDIKRISAHLGMTDEAFREKWLRRERGGDRDWLNKTEPCQFLNLKDNKCSIYEVRPADCAGFPHLAKKFRDYAHVHKQNLELCPATHRLVVKMMERANL